MSSGAGQTPAPPSCPRESSPLLRHGVAGSNYVHGTLVAGSLGTACIAV